jgi:hypothetical protein
MIVLTQYFVMLFLVYHISDNHFKVCVLLWISRVIVDTASLFSDFFDIVIFLID